MSKNFVRFELGIALLLVAVYFLQVATPLRLHPDTVVLLSIAETAEHGGGYLYHGQTTVFPPGYPTLLAFLIRIGFAHVWVIIGLNVAFVVTGLLLVRHLLRAMGFSETFALGVCILSLLSFVFVKYSAVPLTDLFFFCISMCSLAVMNKIGVSKVSWGLLIGAAALVVASVCIRRIGVALIPPLVYAVAMQSDVQLYIGRLSSRTKLLIVIIGASVVASLGIAAIIWGTRTASTLVDLSALLRGQALIESVRGVVSFRSRELGEIAVNLPFAALPRIVQPCIPIIGAVTLLLILGGVASRKRFGLVETYFVSYLVVILAWPFYDPRFWLPVLPLLIAYCGLAIRRLIRVRIVMRMVEVYVMTFVLMGMLTLESNTRVSFSGSGFGDLYTEGRYHSTYCAVWQCKDPDSAGVDPDGLHLLRYYQRN